MMICSLYVRSGMAWLALSQEDDIILGIYVNDLQFLVMRQGIQNVIFCEASGGVSRRMHLLELINNHSLVHLLHLLLLHDVADVIDYTRRLVVVAEAVILF